MKNKIFISSVVITVALVVGIIVEKNVPIKTEAIKESKTQLQEYIKKTGLAPYPARHWEKD